MKNVVIGIPSGVMVHADFAMSLAALVTESTVNGFRLLLVNKQRTRIELNRLGIVLIAQQQKADGVLFLDTDMVFPSDTLGRLVSANKRIIACNASKRVEGAGNTAELIPGVAEKGVTKVKSIGTGIMLIDLKVFDKLKMPYFQAIWQNGKFLGEDLFFVKQAQKVGERVWCDHDLSREISHIGTKHYKILDD